MMPEPSTPSLTAKDAVNAPLVSTTLSPPAAVGAGLGLGLGLGTGAASAPAAGAKRSWETTGGVVSTRNVADAVGPAVAAAPAVPSAWTWKE